MPAFTAVLLVVLAAAQGTTTAPPTPLIVDAQTLDAIRVALATPTVDLREPPRFLLTVLGSRRSLADDLREADFSIVRMTAPGSVPGGGGGFDPGQLINAIKARLREREARRIRARIEQELKHWQ